MVKAEQYLSQPEVAALGLAAFGRNVFISRHATITHPERLHLGSMIRIDAFSSILGREEVKVGNHVHIGSSVTINANAPVSIGDFSGISAGVKLFTTDDDYSGLYLTGPTVPPEFTNITAAPVELREHCVIGANSVILPGAILEEGVAVGALSLVKGTLSSWGIYGGVPARLLKARSRNLIELAAKLDS